MADTAGIHLELFDIVRSRDLSRLLDLFAPDYVYVGPDGVAMKGATFGIEVAQKYLDAFADLSLDITNQIVSGDTSVVEFTATGTHTGELEGIPATGRKVVMAVCNIVTVRNDYVVSEHEYYDGADMLRQLGVMEG